MLETGAPPPIDLYTFRFSIDMNLLQIKRGIKNLIIPSYIKELSLDRRPW